MLPDIYFFNPTCELAIANGSPYYTAPARLRKFEQELAYLPAWLGGENDQVLVQGEGDKSYCEQMGSLGFKLATPITLATAMADPAWLNQPKGRLVPWGWSPAVYQLFQPLFPMFDNQFRQSAVGKWQTAHKHLYSRLTAMTLLNTIRSGPIYDWLPDQSAVPVACDKLEAIYAQIASADRAVVKTPWSSSGRGLLLFPNIDSKKKNEEVLHGMLNQQGFVTVEPWRQKLMDLSYQFQSKGGKITYMGRTIFETDQKGRYQRNFLDDRPEASIEVCNYLEKWNDEVVSVLGKALSSSGYATLYEGWIGVDAIIFKTAGGELKFQPMVEINGRYTMGAIALKIRNHLAEGSTGYMQLYYSKSSNFFDFCQKKAVEKPLMMKNHKIVSGFLPLTPPQRANHFGAYIECENVEM
jgi:hypothetical protein